MTARRSNRRLKQAAATRQDILSAARRLFAEQGYVGTSMAAIAEEAETAVQTIYDSVGPKRAIMLALVDVIDDQVGVAQTVQQLGQTRDPNEMISLMVRVTRQFAEHCGDVEVAIMSAAPTEPDVAAALDEANRRHRGGGRLVAESIANVGALKPDVSVQHAGDVIAVLTVGTMWQQLTQEHGWSFDECEAWMTETLTTLLLKKV